MKTLRSTLYFLLFVLILPNYTFGQSCCSKTAAETEETKTSIANLDFNNYTLTDHNGEIGTLESRVKGKVVVMNFIFTSCRTICPPMGANFAAMKKEIGEANDEMIMLSVSLDPKTDDPARLKKWKKQFGSTIDDTGTLLTGQKSIRDVILFPILRPEG